MYDVTFRYRKRRVRNTNNRGRVLCALDCWSTTRNQGGSSNRIVNRTNWEALYTLLLYTLELSFVLLSTKRCLLCTNGQISQVIVVYTPKLKELEQYFDSSTIRSCKLLQQIQEQWMLSSRGAAYDSQRSVILSEEF